MFIAKPYSLPEEVATVLAQICCCNNSIPQGAPTSPVISNMICARLVSDLHRLAQRYNCLYTRYADDVTFSTRTSKFPKSLARTEETTTGMDTTAAGELQKIVEDNGFTVNARKTRVQTKLQRQAITGITINEFPNVTRRYLNQVRAMLHAWEKFGLPLPRRSFCSGTTRKAVIPNSHHPPLSVF